MGGTRQGGGMDALASVRAAIRGSEITLTVSLAAAFLVYRWLSRSSSGGGTGGAAGPKPVEVEPLEKDHVYNKAQLASYNGTNEARGAHRHPRQGIRCDR